VAWSESEAKELEAKYNLLLLVASRLAVDLSRVSDYREGPSDYVKATIFILSESKGVKKSVLSDLAKVQENDDY
jgi:hypothetical protein